MIERLISVAENLGWKVSKEDDYMFQNCSPAGQDICFSIEADFGEVECFVDSLRRYYESYDPSQEAMYWLDESGHGKNGAPYEMCDVYEDVERCRDMIGELYRAICYAYFTEVKNDEECWCRRILPDVFTEFATVLVDEFNKNSRRAVSNTLKYYKGISQKDFYDIREAVFRNLLLLDEEFSEKFSEGISVEAVVDYLDSVDYESMKWAVRDYLTNAFTEEYATQILEKETDNGETIEAEIIDDIRSSSEWQETGYYNDDDVRLAIGRVIMRELGLEV